MSLPIWTAKYVGIPFLDKGRTPDGYDCYGLAMAIWREEFGLDVPSFLEDYATATDHREIAALITAELERGPWGPIFEPDAKCGDAIILTVAGRPWHLGIVLDPPWFLHVDPPGKNRDRQSLTYSGSLGVIRERWTDPAWRGRVEGFVRHEGLTCPAA